MLNIDTIMLFVGFSAVDFTWLLLSLIFLLAFSLHVFLFHSSAKFTQSRSFQLFQDLIRYGKTKNSQRPAYVRVFDVPKRWFSHFYMVSVVWNGLLITLSLRTSLLGSDLPLWLSNTLGFLTDSSAAAWKGVPLSTALAQMLLWVHSARRLQECAQVSVFSGSVIHAAQYAFGLGYYVLLGLTVLCVGGPHLQEGTPASLTQLQWCHAAGILLFLWGSLHQHRCLRLLAHLRTGASELVIYVSLAIVTGGRVLTWWLVVLYVLFNQALAAQLCHEFYRRKFEHYPKQRKAFIPFLF
ncbi:polyprenol reductase isoform X2 [Anguilla anguilla]|uniref:polyprenol reductase isoform X2 n=1 Tax=Anguilla anguilla TaxID=7936 RepID=UPI0015A84ED4|nr:polyprenol reductase isoform X2 [Anguilla anguilla]